VALATVKDNREIELEPMAEALPEPTQYQYKVEVHIPMYQCKLFKKTDTLAAAINAAIDELPDDVEGRNTIPAI
jgi:hypothetical protein